MQHHSATSDYNCHPETVAQVLLHSKQVTCKQPKIGVLLPGEHFNLKSSR